MPGFKILTAGKSLFSRNPNNKSKMIPKDLTTSRDIALVRLVSQQISDPSISSARKVVSWMGAMQAQDFEWVKWAVGLRMGKATRNEVEAAYNKGEILRTHLLRPTWHMVAREDLVWILELTSANIKTRYIPRNRYLGLSNTIFKQSEKVIQRTLETKGESTREELIAELNKAKISTAENRASHLLATAELDCLICSGALRDGKITYALLEKRIPKPAHLNKEEALASLAKRFLLSRSPASLDDFKWWSGLSAKDSRIGIAANKDSFEATQVEGKEILVNKLERFPAKPGQIQLLPAFDEFIISYADRGAFLPRSKQTKAVSNNGIFRPTAVRDGQVIGIWKPLAKPDSILIEVTLFEGTRLSEKIVLEKTVQRYGDFLGKTIDILFNQ
jgi:hypothetical protein